MMMRIVPAFAVIVALTAVAASGFWLDVPFVKQEGNGCGAASISMVMQYWARQKVPIRPDVYDPQKIMRLLYSKSDSGIFASDMEKYFQNHAFRTFTFVGSRNELEKHLQKGRPLIVCLDWNNNRKDLHYVVVAGLNNEEQTVLINDPAGKKLSMMEWTDFEKRWKAMRYWTLLALPEASA